MDLIRVGSGPASRGERVDSREARPRAFILASPKTVHGLLRRARGSARLISNVHQSGVSPISSLRRLCKDTVSAELCGARRWARLVVGDCGRQVNRVIRQEYAAAAREENPP